jgi:hypothetical protein
MAFHCTIAFLYTVFDFKARASAKSMSHEHIPAVLVCKINRGMWNKGGKFRGRKKRGGMVEEGRAREVGREGGRERVKM